jgi:hypothetical protein
VFFEVRVPVSQVTASLPESGAVACFDRISIGPRMGPDSPEAIYPPPALP